MKQVTILGSTSTIGVNTLDVISTNRDKYSVFALTANTNIDLLEQQCRTYAPTYAALRHEKLARELGERLSDLPTVVVGGDNSLCDVASHPDTDMVMAAILGSAGLQPTLAAVRAGKRILLANKESLVMSGKLFMEQVRSNEAMLLPIDSEHNAIYQCLANGAVGHASGVKRLILTGSGGPLLRADISKMITVTPDQACAHPNWKMGRKISVDSATMMNKGLELLEASFLFDISPGLIDVMIHPESIVHSMVEYLDGSVVAQLGNPDMRTPIAHGLAWPDRVPSSVEPLNLTSNSGLHFEEVDHDRFPCLRLAREISEEPQGLFIALNAANEVAVKCFLDELIAFTDIPVIIEAVLEQTKAEEAPTIESVIELDRAARELALNRVNRKS
ncbi:MAG TPA: 1-deoxy-D-xylulose-5-phosphate reductoisomerase [Gammaproteobacteria bacterium]|nr:1-deoxy-D-xylulose-5-phosphate reductoisomerase [Gammaproteobacteria bacterium]